jgi:hypothetical protein
MLRFFRQIRQKLLENGNLRKYFWYALGEILLVMIGILLALQINNWNQDRQERNYEQKMLAELSTVLESDINHFINIENYTTDMNTSILYLADALNTEDHSELNMDSVKYHLESVWEFGVILTYNDGPYESLKSIGLDKISNDLLRKEITNLYSFRLPALNHWINEIIRISIEEKINLGNLLFDVKVTRNGQALDEELIVEDLSFLENPIFVDLLRESYSVTRGVNSSIVRNRSQMESILSMLNEELDSFTK